MIPKLMAPLALDPERRWEKLKMPAPPPFAAASEAWSLASGPGEAPEPLQIWPSWGIRGIWLSYTRETKAAAAFI